MFQLAMPAQAPDPNHFPTRPAARYSARMPRSSPARPPRRSNAEYRWTRDKVLVFLRVLALRGSVAKAAREVEMSRQSAYRLRARLGAEFARIWDEGLAIGAALRRDGLVQDGRFVRGPQGDTPGLQGDTGGLQSDRFSAQGDTFAVQGDGFGRQGDTGGAR